MSIHNICYHGLSPREQSVAHLTADPGRVERSMVILPVSLIQEGQLSVINESICTKYWLIATRRSLPREKCV